LSWKAAGNSYSPHLHLPYQGSTLPVIFGNGLKILVEADNLAKINITYLEKPHPQIPLISIRNMIQTDNNSGLNTHLKIDIISGFNSLR